MEEIKRTIFFVFVVFVTSLLVVPNSNVLEAGSIVKPSEDSRLVGKGYLVIIFYVDHITFDYYDFLEDGSFIIWTIEESGEGEYSIRDELLFRAQFEGALSENIAFTHQIKGLILSEKLIFGEGEEYFGTSKGKRYNFLGIYSDTNADLGAID